MKKSLFAISLVFLLTSVSYAQNITGQVVDEKNIPLVGVNVILLSKVDSAYLAGTGTDKDGVFTLAHIAANPPSEKFFTPSNQPYRPL